MDLALDAPQGWGSFHVLYEVALISGALGLVAWLWRGWWRAEASARVLRRTLAERQAERDAWRTRAERALEGLGRAVAEQFDGLAADAQRAGGGPASAQGTGAQADRGRHRPERAHRAPARGGGVPEVGTPGPRRARRVLPGGSGGTIADRAAARVRTARWATEQLLSLLRSGSGVRTSQVADANAVLIRTRRRVCW